MLLDSMQAEWCKMSASRRMPSPEGLGTAKGRAARHTFASRLAMAGVDLLVIKELGGWKTLAMVMRYAHLSPGCLREGIERLVGAPLLAASVQGREQTRVTLPTL